jgi:succinate dehydrogenase flavin-adding protein (antitoxin of CptAB toxin-antitoxin module)
MEEPIAELRRVRTERLRWHSRRALLELDLVLQRFWQKQPEALAGEQAEVLERLLVMEDHDLWELLSGRQDADDPVLQDMVVLLRQPAGSF